ncbi:MAG: hypothetical protein ABR581_03825 [Thermoleophilaceae bacterium]
MTDTVMPGMPKSGQMAAIACGVLLWTGAVLLLFTGDWYLECVQDGVRLGGTDCFQSTPQSARIRVPLLGVLGWPAVSLLFATAFGAPPAVLAYRFARRRRSRKRSS